MATIWQKSLKGKHYEVRQAGASVRLYTNGVFHSQYNAKHRGQGSLWDMLALPSNLIQAHSHARALVLGVGGGAAINYLNLYRQWEEIIGIDLDATHLSIAKRFFGLKNSHQKLVCADAVQWLQNYSGKKFNFILDDLFGEQQDDLGFAVRAVELSEQWARQLLAQLAEGGVLVLNIESPKHARLAKTKFKKISQRGSLLTLSHDRYENQILIFCIGANAPVSKDQLLDTAPPRLRSDYTVTRTMLG